MAVRLPASILLHHVAPFLADRRTWNALVMVNKEHFELSQEFTEMAPWPQVRLRVAAGQAWSVAFGNGYVACGTERGRIQIWDKRDGSTRVLRDQHKRRVHSMFAIQDLLITGSEDGTILVWKSQDWSKASRFSVYKGGVSCMFAWPYDSQKIRVAAACVDRKIRFLTVQDNGGTIEFGEGPAFTIIETTHKGPIHAICKIGRLLVSGGSDEQLLAWDLMTSRTEEDDRGEYLRLSQPHHRVPLRNLGDVRSFSVHNKDILAVACGKTVLLYDGNLRQTKILKGHYSNIRSVAFSRDGELVASACSDGTIRLWNTAEEICFEKWEGHSSFLVCALAFQKSSMVSVGSDGTIALWRIPRS